MSPEPNSSWVYVAWIRNLQFPSGDQDAESPAIILVDAVSAEDAKVWGDQLYAQALSGDDQHEFLWSEVHRPDDPRYHGPPAVSWVDTPRCRVGERLPNHVLY